MSEREARAAEALAKLRAERNGVGRKILAIDPGTAASGVCLLEDGAPTLLKVVRVKGATAEDRLPEMCKKVGDLVRHHYNIADTFAVEWQMIRPTDKRPDDILLMAMVVGAVLAHLPSDRILHTPLPVQWKGSIPGDKFTPRIQKLFPTAGDLMHDCPAHLQHNGWDALGLAVWAIRKALPWQ